jgi:rhodanese-related sulfurtransferase
MATIWKRAAWQIPVLVILSAVAAFSTNAFRAERLPLVGDFSPAARMTISTGQRIDITLEEAEKLFRSQAAVFIDARSPKDYAEGHIQASRNLPFQEVDAQFMAVTSDLEPDSLVITYCDGEKCELSHELALFLRDAGFTNTRVLINGWTLWQQAGLPVASIGPKS